MNSDNTDNQSINKRHLLIIALGLLLVIGLNIAWESCSAFSLRNDSAIHALVASSMGKPDAPQYPYPKLVHSITFQLIKIMGDNQWPFFTVQACYLVILILSTYVGTTKLANNRAGLIASLLLLFSLQTVVSLRTFFLDYPLAAMLMLQYTAYLYSDSLRKPGPTLLFCVLIPVCFFTRMHYVCSAGILFSAIFIDLARRQKWHKRDYVQHLLAFVIPLAALVYVAKANMNPIAILYSLFATTAATSLILNHSRCFRSNKTLHFLSLVSLFCLATVYAHTHINTHIEFGNRVSENVLFASDNDADDMNKLQYGQFPLGDYITFIGNGISLKVAAALGSRYFLIYLVELKSKLMLPFFFYVYALCFIYTMANTKLRRKTFCLWWTILLCSLFYAAVTTNNTRYQAPLFTFRCIIVAICLARLRWIPTITVAISAAISMCISGGWMFNKIPQAPCSYIQSELLNSNIRIDIYQITLVPTSQGTRIAFQVPLTIVDLLNQRSAWSDSLFFTIAPYAIHWRDFTAKANKLLDIQSRVKVAIYYNNHHDALTGWLTRNPELTNECDMSTMLNYANSINKPNNPQNYATDAPPVSACSHVAIIYSVDTPPPPLRAKLLLTWSSDSIGIDLYSTNYQHVRIPKKIE